MYTHVNLFRLKFREKSISVRYDTFTGVDRTLHLLYNYVTVLNTRLMTVTTNDQGQMNMWAKEPQMYYSKEQMDRYGLETYAERAEKLNGRVAMLGFVAGLLSYVTTGSLFFFGAFGI